jgi:hypothetical protein
MAWRWGAIGETGQVDLAGDQVSKGRSKAHGPGLRADSAGAAKLSVLLLQGLPAQRAASAGGVSRLRV